MYRVSKILLKSIPIRSHIQWRIASTAQILGTTQVSLGSERRPANYFPRARREAAPTVRYARVSSYHQKADLEGQQAVLETHCAARGWRTEAIRNRGSVLANC